MLAEDAYFMRVDNRVTQVLLVRTHEPRSHEATSRSPADGGRNRTYGEQPPNPNCSRASAAGPSQGGNSQSGADGIRGGASRGDGDGGVEAAGAHHMERAEEPVAAVIMGAEATQTTTSLATHVAATMPTIGLTRFVAKRL
jgi:hypothetical protein